MPMLHAESGHDSAVTPVVAIILLVAITVVLASVMYLVVSQLTPPIPQNPQPLGIVVEKAGTNWVIKVVVVSAGVSPQFVYISISDPNGTPMLPYTPISNMTGFLDTSPTGILSAGDRILLPLQNYPEDCLVTIKDDQRLLFQGSLRA